MVNTNRLDPYQKLNENDSTLNECFSTIKQQIHSVLCDSFNTQSVMEYLGQLVSTTTHYMNKPNENINYHLIENIVVYLTRLINIFGLNSSVSSDDYLEYTRPTQQQTSTFNMEDIAMRHVEQSPLFRDAERTDAIAV
jgi:cysteinyl-tRNA synthetase